MLKRKNLKDKFQQTEKDFVFNHFGIEQRKEKPKKTNFNKPRKILFFQSFRN